ncbi:MAG: hypothetical protein IJN48_00285 [Clostridia bacterium]|nr:hypothetical protein [Clostridia bacterium]
MDLLKKIFPFSFGAKDVAALVIKVILYIVAGMVAGVLIGLLASVPVVNIVVGFVGGLVDLYVTAGIVITFLSFFKVIK